MLRSQHQDELQSVIHSYLPVDNTATSDFANQDIDLDLDEGEDDYQEDDESHPNTTRQRHQQPHRTSSSHHQQQQQQQQQHHTKSTLSLPATTEPPSPSNPPSQKVWLIFGATGHMGRSIAKSAIAHDDIVCCVGQSYTDSLEAMQNWFPAGHASDRYLGLLCDVRIMSTVKEAIEKCKSVFGRVDVIANCSGYGVIGACEDQDEAEVRNQWETNFVGLCNVVWGSLGYFRERGEGGRYLIFSSTSGALGVPGLGPYCATKYAVEGLIESMLYEVEGFGVRFTLVEPGHMRRDDVFEGGGWGSPGLQKAKVNGRKDAGKQKGKEKGKEKEKEKEQLPLFGHFKIAKPSPPYDTKDAPANHARRILQWIGDHQPTSVAKAAELVWQLGHCSYPPLRLLLGTYAVESVRDRLKSVIEEIEDWKYLHFPPLEDDNKEDGDEEDGGEDEGEKEGEDERDEGEQKVKAEEDEEDAEMEGA